MTDYFKTATDLLGAYKNKIFPSKAVVTGLPEGDKSKAVPIDNSTFESNGISNAPQIIAMLVGGIILVVAYKEFWAKK